MKPLLSMFLGSVAVIGGALAADQTPAAPTTITTLSGRTYQSVKILKAYPNGLAFRHSSGAAQISFADLPEALQKQFQYTPEAAQAYEKEHFEAERLAAEKAALVRAERRKKQEEVKFAALQMAMLREQSAAANSGYGVGGYFDYGVPTWGYGYGADYAFPPVLGQGLGVDGLGPDRGHRHGHAYRSAINNLFYNYNTTKYIGPYSGLYSGALTNSNVRPVLTFGGYRYPTAVAARENVAVKHFNRNRPYPDPRVNAQGGNRRPGGIGHMRGGGRPAFVPANSAGARIGGTGGVMRVGSPRISHQ